MPTKRWNRTHEDWCKCKRYNLRGVLERKNCDCPAYHPEMYVHPMYGVHYQHRGRRPLIDDYMAGGFGY